MKLYLRCSILVISTFLFVVPGIVSASWQPEITVGISHGVAEAEFSGRNAPLYVYTDEQQKSPILTIPQKEKLRVRFLHNTFELNGKLYEAKQLYIQAGEDESIYINDMPYRGYVTLLKQNGMTVINHVLTEDYLYGVVPKEMPSTWPMGALRAQSIAARTFALKNRNRHSEQGFDLCNTAHCQVYEGSSAETKETTEAVDRTRGEVMFYHGAIIDAVFHTDSGGMTESAEQVWGSYVPYLRAVSELQTKTKPWTQRVSTALFMKKMEENGKKIGLMKSIHLSPLSIGKGSKDRSPSGRVQFIEVLGDKGNCVVSGSDLRRLFALPSTLFDVQRESSDIVFHGYGGGHGLGLSQWGAKAFADRGKTDREILSHYYTDITIEKIY